MAEHKIPSITADIFIVNEKMEFILIRRKNDPYKNCWALPGGFMEYGETIENAAIREAKEETSIDVELIDLVNVYSEPSRDPRGHTVTVAFLARGDFTKRKAASDAEDIGIFSHDDIDKLDIAFDHRKIIEDSLNKAKKG